VRGERRRKIKEKERKKIIYHRPRFISSVQTDQPIIKMVDDLFVIPPTDSSFTFSSLKKYASSFVNKG
jgi:hypothetical protein